MALGKLPNGPLTALLRRLFFRVYKKADQVVVLSEDMRDLLLESAVPSDKVKIVPNWVDTRRVVPVSSGNDFRQRHGLNDRFVVMYSGNMGLSQRLENVLEAAGQLRHRQDVAFVLIGDGASRRRLESLAAERGLDNMHFFDYQPKSDLSTSLSAADLHLVPVDQRVIRHLMPSKIYGILAAGSPMLVLAPEDCELSRLTRDHGVGYVVTSEDPTAIAERIGHCADRRQQLLTMGQRARELAVAKFDRRIATWAFEEQLNQLVTDGERDVAVAEPAAAEPFPSDEFAEERI